MLVNQHHTHGEFKSQTITLLTRTRTAGSCICVVCTGDIDVPDESCTDNRSSTLVSLTYVYDKVALQVLARRVKRPVAGYFLRKQIE